MMWILNLIIQKNGISLYQKMLDLEKINLFTIFLLKIDDITYEAYVSEQNLLMDDSGEPINTLLLRRFSQEKKGLVTLSFQTKENHFLNTISSNLRHSRLLKLT